MKKKHKKVLGGVLKSLRKELTGMKRSMKRANSSKRKSNGRWY